MNQTCFSIWINTCDRAGVEISPWLLHESFSHDSHRIPLNHHYIDTDRSIDLLRCETRKTNRGRADTVQYSVYLVLCISIRMYKAWLFISWSRTITKLSSSWMREIQPSCRSSLSWKNSIGVVGVYPNDVLSLAMASALTTLTTQTLFYASWNDYIELKMKSFLGNKASKCPMMIITRRSTKKNNFSDRELKSIQVAQFEKHDFLNTSITLMMPHH